MKQISESQEKDKEKCWEKQSALTVRSGVAVIFQNTFKSLNKAFAFIFSFMISFLTVVMWLTLVMCDVYNFLYNEYLVLPRTSENDKNDELAQIFLNTRIGLWRWNELHNNHLLKNDQTGQSET